MSLHSVNEINSLADPLKQFLSTFVITTPNCEAFAPSVAKQLELRAQSFSWPTIQADNTTVMWGGHERQYAGKQIRGGDWGVTFTEVYSGDIIDGFKKWCNGFHNFKNGTISLFENYATTIEVQLLNPELYDPGVTTAVAKKIQLLRAWPTNVSVAGDIQPSSSDPVEISVSFHYDYFLMGDEINGQ